MDTREAEICTARFMLIKGIAMTHKLVKTLAKKKKKNTLIPWEEVFTFSFEPCSLWSKVMPSLYSPVTCRPSTELRVFSSWGVDHWL